MSFDQAEKRITEWVEGFPLKVLPAEYHPELVESITKINEELIKENGNDYKMGETDMHILASFINNKIGIIHVRDKVFELTAEQLALTVIKTPKRDIEKENYIKKKFNH